MKSGRNGMGVLMPEEEVTALAYSLLCPNMS